MIKAEQVFKRYNRSWIIKDFSYSFEQNNCYAVTGANGSGKSTLLYLLSGFQAASKGKIQWQKEGKEISKENLFKELSICSPAMELVEEMTLSEFLDFHFTFKKIAFLSQPKEIIDLLELEKQSNQKIGEFSSGMKQRVKLAQAFFSQTHFLLLDEPTSYLDDYWVKKYQSWMQSYTQNRICIVASNDQREYNMIDQIICL